MDELVEAINPIFEHMRKMDGTKYTSEVKKSIQSSLNYKGLFENLKHHRYSVNFKEAKKW